MIGCILQTVDGMNGEKERRSLDDIPSGQIVTATALIRHFATHSRHALSEPVHIMNHGHISLSLISTELFVQLSNGQRTTLDIDDNAASLDLLLDLIATKVILVDRALNLVRINLAARKRLEVSEHEARNKPLSQLLVGPDYYFVLRALERVRDTGVAEEFELSPFGRQSWLYRVQIMPFRGGFALLADEITDRVTLRDQDARTAAYEYLIDGLPSLARGAFNLRGCVTHVSPALAQLMGTDENRILGVRFGTLFDVASRGTIGDAMENLLTSGTPFGMTAGFVGGDAGSEPIWINAAPLRTADGQTGGVFLIGTIPNDRPSAVRGGADQ
ncbi:PAS domain-containing protein [Sphingobium estronivorans]|uniref:PAS domain-containing protein n=1 Tax=Sphingobium estronivorans TaxID=1577690 RepID=UPI001238D666|nr:PAS domain-containing protein [Sphingobium estronivorans]